MLKKVLMVLLAVSCLALPGYADKGVAQVTGVKGEVTKNNAPLKIFSNVEAGDKLHVAAGAQVTLFFLADQHKEIIQGDSSFAVTATGSSAPANKKVVQQASAGLKVKGGSVASLNSDQYGGSVKRGGAEQVLSAISARHSLSNTPELRWTSVEGAANYVVSVQKDFGDTPFITENVTGTSVKLSKPLDRGKVYIWKVEARTADGKELGEDIADVEVLSDAKVNAIKAARSDFESAKKKSPDDASSYIAMAARYMEEGLPSEAIAVFQELATKNPSNPYPHERLSVLYKSMGMDKESKEQEAKAAELSK